MISKSKLILARDIMGYICKVCGKESNTGVQDQAGNIYCSEACFRRTWPKCANCGKPMNSWIESEGKKYCGEDCLKTTYPCCSVCGKPMSNWIESGGKKYCGEDCLKTTYPHCFACGKPMKQWISFDDGRKFCDELCFQSTLPRCRVCGKPVNGGLVDKEGNKYCDDNCFQKILPTCRICGKPMKNWITSADDGEKYCSEKCFEKTWPTCDHCGKRMNSWLEYINGKNYCSEECTDTVRPKCVTCGRVVRQGFYNERGMHFCSRDCYELSLPKCRICGKRVEKGYKNDTDYFCSDACYEKSLPTCHTCGRPIRQGVVDERGRNYCSETCYEKQLPRCTCCGKTMRQWVIDDKNRNFCNEGCYQKYIKESQLNIEMESTMTAEELVYLTGLDISDIETYMSVNNLNGDQALESIDIFMHALNDNVSVPVDIANCMNNAGIYSKMASRLSDYNTMRGGVKGYGGFVFEEMHAADAASKGVDITVLADNGIADFIVRDSSGKEILVQAKAGYKPKQIDWEKYKGQTIVVDKGNTALAEEARAAGLSVQESAIYKKQANVVARAQQFESKLTGSVNAPITGAAFSSHYAGLASAKFAARVGVSMKMGENIYDVLSGEKDFSEAAGEIVVDGIKIVGGAYVGGAALTMVGTVATAATTSAAATALASSAVGVAVTGAVEAATATAIGGAVASTVGIVASGAASVVTSIASAPVLPVVAVCAAIGFVGKLFKKKR